MSFFYKNHKVRFGSKGGIYIMRHGTKEYIPVYDKYKCTGNCYTDDKIRKNGVEYDTFSYNAPFYIKQINIPKKHFKETEQYTQVHGSYNHLAGITVKKWMGGKSAVFEDLYFNKDGSYTKIVKSGMPSPLLCRVNCKPFNTTKIINNLKNTF